VRVQYGSLLSGAAALGAVLAIAGAAQAEGKRDRLPPAVAKVVDENKPGAEIDKLEIEKESGITLYDIEFKGDQGEIEVAADGTVIDVVTIVDMKDVPEAAAAAIRKAARGAAIKRLEKSEVRSKIVSEGGTGKLSRLAAPEYVYEAELSKGGEVEVGADGTIIKGPK